MGLLDSIRNGAQKAAKMSQTAISKVADKTGDIISQEKLKQGKAMLAEKVSVLTENTSQLAKKLPGKDDVAGAIDKVKQTARQAIGRK